MPGLSITTDLAARPSRGYPARVMESPERIQLHLVLPYKHEVGDHPQVKTRLDDGYRIVQLQRVSDREVLVTLSR